MKNHSWTTESYEKLQKKLLKDISSQIKKYFIKQALKSAVPGGTHVAHNVQVRISQETEFTFTLEEISDLH